MTKEDEGLKLLKDCRSITHQIETLQEQIDQIYATLTSNTSKAKEINVQSSLPSDPMADSIIKMLEYQSTLEKYQAELCQKKTRCINIIMQMDIKEQQLLTIRYIRGKSIEKTAEETDKSYYWTWQQLNKAEEHFCEIYSAS